VISSATSSGVHSRPEITFQSEKVALLALKLAVVFLDRPAALRTRRRHRRVHHVRNLAVLDDADEIAHQVPDLAHELIACHIAVLDQLELVLPFAGELGRSELDDAEHVQRKEQREGLGRRDELATFPMDVLLLQQSFDDRCAGRGRAKPLGLHRGAQLVVLDELARAFHRREQGRLGVARRRLRAIGLRRHFARECAFGRGDGRKRLAGSSALRP
jgi:hypothetical protein